MNRKSIVLICAAVLALTGSPGIATPRPALRLIVTLGPATNTVVPLGPGEPAVYEFKVYAFDSVAGRIQVLDQVFVRSGQTKKLEQKFGGVEVKGVVSLSDASTATYRAELIENGARTVATEASVSLVVGR